MRTPYEFNLTSLLRTTCTTIIYFSFFCSLVCALSFSFSFFFLSTLILFIYSFVVVKQLPLSPKRHAFVCLKTTRTHAYFSPLQQTNEGRERESKPTSNNIYVCKEKRQVHDKSKE